jgi:hypothetical protein
MKKLDITAEIINDLFRYEDGLLIRKVTITQYARKGDVVGHVGNSGYMSCSIVGTMFLVHRAIFLMHHGYLPKYVDHIDGNRLNNRIENLRPATVYENAQNQKLFKNNTSGVKGVSWNKLMNKWEANITYDGTRERLGWFNSIDEAKKVIDKARTTLHGDFAKHK